MQAGKIELELLAIRTLCAGKDAGLTLLNNLTGDHFYYQSTKLMHRRLMARMKSEGTCPDWNDLLNDPTIPEEKRQLAQRQVKVKKIKPLVSKNKGTALLNSLDRYRKIRAFYETISKAGNAIRQPSADPDVIIKRAKSELIAIDVDHRGSPIAVDGIRQKHVVSAITDTNARIETGHSEFDEKSGGIPKGAVVLLGADTGGYKSVEALCMATSMAKAKRAVAFYSLEMTLAECTQRLIAKELEIDITKEINEWQWRRRKAEKAGKFSEVKKLDEAQAARAQEIAPLFEEKTKDWIEFLHFVCPAEEVDINWILQQAEMSDREVVFIDYLGLLSGLDGDDQWKAMSNATRQCKIWANRTGKTIVLLAQMRFEDGKPELKYSKAVRDHVNNSWGWSTLEVDGRTYICVHQTKARGGARYHFILRVWPEFNKIGDLVDYKDEEVAKLAISDIKQQKDPAKRYAKADGNAEAGRTELDESSVDIRGGGFAGGVKSYEMSTNNSKIGTVAGKRVTSSEILKAANHKTRVVALGKLKGHASNLTIEEAAIQAEEILRRWEDASIGHRINIKELAREVLGLSQTKEILNQVRRLQGDKLAQRKLTPQQLEVHKAQIEVITNATKAIKAKGREFVSEEDFYEKSDLELKVERGYEPVASPNSLDHPWEVNAINWANQPAITLPNSAKPKEKRWGVSSEPDSVTKFKRICKTWANDKGKTIPVERVILWPPKLGKVSDYHYLDDIQLDSVVDIAAKLAVVDVTKIDLDTLADNIDKYTELMGPGIAKIQNKKRPRLVLTDDTYEAAKKKLGIANE